MGQVLEGIKVIDVSQVAAVPMCARLLADFGADVVHVEHPVTGDSWRVFQAVTEAQNGCAPCNINYNWENFNRNKRSATIDISKETGRKIIHNMVKQADIFVSNLRSFELERYKLQYDDLYRINPRIVYGNVTGYGKEGPDKDLPAYDTTAFWARSGFPNMLSFPGVPCLGYRPAIGDNVAALALAYGIMMALYQREKTGEGQEVDVSLLHTGLHQISFDVAGALASGLDVSDWMDQPPPEAVNQAQAAIMQVMAHYGARATNPLTSMYLTQDFKALLFVVLQPDRYWAKFCQAIGREDLGSDPKYSTIEGRAEHIAFLRQAIGEAFLTKTLTEWRPLLEGIPYAPMQSIKEAINDPQARESGCFVSYDHPEHGRIEMVASPIMLSKDPATVRMAAPEFGQHTEEVLLEYGYSWEDITSFKEQEVIA
jgi:crotonobetainyl-CoA:carnitine CoA-transferase CaiB-like acyl-CoA transferase